jgi:low affinity Fe/Cu permease
VTNPDVRLTLRDRFNAVADSLTNALGSLPALAASVVLVIIWALTGPFFHFSDTWQLFINTTTTVITFWMVFVIQNSANRASKATQLKLDELIRAVSDARNEFINLDHAPEEVLVEHEQEFSELADPDADGQDEESTTRRRTKVTRKVATRPAAASRRGSRGRSAPKHGGR